MAMHRNAIAWATMTDKDIMDVLPALHYSPHNGKGIDIRAVTKNYRDALSIFIAK
jgi:hypothetical protein